MTYKEFDKEYIENLTFHMLKRASIKEEDEDEEESN